MRTAHTRKLVSGGLWLIVLACLWFYFAPTSVGGSTTYVVTDGVSMQPRFHAGDLVAVRSQSSYRVGEIVAYHSRAFHMIVLHRIIARDGSRYVFKGDNNNFVDFEHPAQSQLIGALWFAVPGAGARLQSIHSPALIGALLALATLLLTAGAFTRHQARRRRQRRSAEGIVRPAAPSSQRSLEPVLTVLAIGLLALLPLAALAVLAFTRPATASLPSSVHYHQSGALSYTANAAPGPTYPSGRAVTGEPLFTHVVKAVDVRFGYLFHTAAATHSLRGSVSLSATVSSTSGWQTTLALAPPTYFHGDHALVTGQLDLTSLLALLHRVQTTTDVAGSYTLKLLPRVSVSGSLGTLALHATFAPQIPFSLSQFEMQPVAPAGSAGEQPAASQFAPSTSGSLAGRRTQPQLLSLGFAHPSVVTARRIALGAVAVLVCVLLAALALARPRRRDESAAIRARYGRLIVPVERVWQLPGVPVIDVADIDALVRIAEHYDRSILCERTADGEAFWVTDESGQFRYALGETTGATVEFEAIDQRDERAAQDAASARRPFAPSSRAPVVIRSPQ